MSKYKSQHNRPKNQSMIVICDLLSQTSEINLKLWYLRRSYKDFTVKF